MSSRVQQLVNSTICSSSLSPDYQRPGSVHRNCDCFSDPVHYAGLHRNAGNEPLPVLWGSGSDRRLPGLWRRGGCYRRCSWLSVLLQSYKNNFWLKVPVNFNRNVPCSRNTFADRYIINQRFHNLAGKMFQVGILFNQFAAIIARRNFFFDFG